MPSSVHRPPRRPLGRPGRAPPAHRPATCGVVPAEINVRLDRIMMNALNQIWDTADKHRISLRTATYAVACERILTARAERGLYP